jgi:hypothetical protein
MSDNTDESRFKFKARHFAVFDKLADDIVPFIRDDGLSDKDIKTLLASALDRAKRKART